MQENYFLELNSLFPSIIQKQERIRKSNYSTVVRPNKITELDEAPTSKQYQRTYYDKVLGSSKCPPHRGKNYRKKKTSKYNIVKRWLNGNLGKPYCKMLEAAEKKDLKKEFINTINYDVYLGTDGKLWTSFGPNKQYRILLEKYGDSFYVDPLTETIKYQPKIEHKPKANLYKKQIDGRYYWRINNIWYEVVPIKVANPLGFSLVKYSFKRDYLQEMPFHIRKTYENNICDGKEYITEYTYKKRTLSKKEKKKLGLN